MHSVVLTLLAAGSPNDFGQQDRQTIITVVAQLANVETWQVVVRFMASSLLIVAEVAAESEAAASRVARNLRSSLASASAATYLLRAASVAVEATPTVTIARTAVMLPAPSIPMPPPFAPPAASSEQANSSSKGVIVGAAAGGGAMVVALVACILCLARRRSQLAKSNKEIQFTNTMTIEFPGGGLQV